MLRLLTPDGKLLFATRTVRLFAHGFLSVVFTLYLARRGFTDGQIGLLLSLILVGDTGISLWITLTADRIGRRKMLVLGSGLMVAAGAVFALTDEFSVLLVAGVVGTISPSGGEVGPSSPSSKPSCPRPLRKNTGRAFSLGTTWSVRVRRPWVR